MHSSTDYRKSLIYEHLNCRLSPIWTNLSLWTFTCAPDTVTAMLLCVHCSVWQCTVARCSVRIRDVRKLEEKPWWREGDFEDVQSSNHGNRSENNGDWTKVKETDVTPPPPTQPPSLVSNSHLVSWRDATPWMPVVVLYCTTILTIKVTIVYLLYSCMDFFILYTVYMCQSV